MSDAELLAVDDLRTVCNIVALAAYEADAVPALCHEFLPFGNFLSLLCAVCAESLEACCLRAVEALEVVVELALHRVVRCDACDGVLDGANPVLAVSLAVASVVERYNLLLQHAVDGSCV